MREQLTGLGRRTAALETKLNEVQAALEKLARELFRTEANLRVQVVAVEEAHNAERARVKRFERDIAVEVKSREQLLAEHLVTSKTASRPLAEDGESLQELQSKEATVTAEVRESHELVTETAGELKVARAGGVSQ